MPYRSLPSAYRHWKNSWRKRRQLLKRYNPCGTEGICNPMSQATQISPLPPEMKSQDFGFLRNEGMQLLQRIAGASWTNHNLHDPGITLLEAACYALTEMGLRLGMDIPDLVASDTSGQQQAFFTAAQILPSAPVTINDT